MKKTIRHVYRFIPVFFLVYFFQFLIAYMSPQETGMFAYFTVRTCLAFDPDSDSGANASPEGATPIKQTKDSRWVIYDRGDKTDWLQVSPPSTKDKQLIIHFNFLRVVGTAIIEVYGANPSADFLEKREFEKPGMYEYMAQSVGNHYVKVYAADQGDLAQYEFSYELAPLPTSVSDITLTSTPVPTVTPMITLTPTPTEVPTMLPTPLPTHTPTPVPTPTEVPTTFPTPLPTHTPTPVPTPTKVPTTFPTPLPTHTPTPVLTPTEVPITLPTPSPTGMLATTPLPNVTHALSRSDFQVIGERYGVPSNLLRALSLVGSQNGKVPGDYEVRKVVDDKQAEFLGKIAEDTGRSIADFKGSSAGAMGYIQFLPATFYYYAQDGNGDGIKDPLNSYDSVATAAYFLAQKIAKENSIEAALKSYTSSSTDYEKILQLYRKLETEEKP